MYSEKQMPDFATSALRPINHYTQLLGPSTALRSFTSTQTGLVEPQSVEHDPEKHYKDWPNTQGFDTTYEERTPIELVIEGNIPAYTAGVLFRTGLGPRKVDCGSKGIFQTNHWFDNFAQCHRFQIHAPTDNSSVRVTYNSRLTSDGLIEKVRKSGRLEDMTFARKYEPCKTLFQKLQSYFIPSRLLPKAPPKPNEVNVGVTMSINYPGYTPNGEASYEPRDTTKITSFCTKTDAAGMQFLDSETLEPIGLAKQTILHPDLKGPISGAHAKSDPETGDVFNFNLEFGGQLGTYRVFRTSARGETHVLATIKHTTAYLHSLFLTKNFVIICIWNSHFTKSGMSLLWNQNIVDSMEYNDKEPAKWYVIDKVPVEQHGRGLVATYESDPFFGFHSVNAYEEHLADGSTTIVADVPAYQNLEVLKAFYFENILSNSPTGGQVQGRWGDTLAPRYRRYKLPNVPDRPSKEIQKAVLEFELGKEATLELPMLNWKVFTKKHRYVYGVCDTGKSTFTDGLVKLDLEDKSVKRWSVHGQTAGEPVFVADPESDEEDGGVLLVVVLDGTEGKSYLMVLDARTMLEIGRAKVDGAIGFGFHGIHTKLAAGGSKMTPDY